MAIAKPYTGIDIQFGTDTPPTLGPRDPGSLYYVTSDGTEAGTILELWTFLKTGNWTKTDVAETLTSLSLSTNILSYVDEAGNTTDIDLSFYLDDTNLARLVSGTLDSVTGIATFTRDDNTTFTIDLSALNIKRIQDLTDVQLTSTVTGQVLSWNGTKWANQTLPTGVTTLAELTDVDVATKASGNVLTWNGTDWVATAPAAIPTNLDSLTDVTITSATTNQFVRYNGTSWVNATVAIPTNLDSLTDAVITSAVANQFLRYDGTNWVNTTVAVPTNLDSLTDVTITSAATNQFLRYDGTNWINATVAIPTNLDSLTDTVITSATANQFLRYDGTNWINATVAIPTNLDSLTDVVITTPSSGQALTYNGTNWVNTTLSGGGTGGGATEYDQLLDVDVTTMPPSRFAIAAWDETVSKWRTAVTPKVTFVDPPVTDLTMFKTSSTVKSGISLSSGWTAGGLLANDDFTQLIALTETGSAAAYPWYSLDKGLTWTQSATQFQTEYAYNAFRLGNKWCVTGVNAFAKSYVTSNGGASWTYNGAVTNGIDGEWAVIPFHFADFAMVLIGGATYRTTTSATLPNWTANKTFPYGITDISVGEEAVGKNYGIIIQTNGTVHKVTGADTYIANYGIAPAGMNQITWDPLKQCFYGVIPNTLVGAGPVILYKSVDGSSWTEIFRFDSIRQTYIRSLKTTSDGKIIINVNNGVTGAIIVNSADPSKYVVTDISGFNVPILSKTENIYLKPSSNNIVRGTLYSYAELEGVVYPEYTINDLDNVNVADVQNGDVLSWDEVSQSWINSVPAAELSTLTDVDTTLTNDSSLLMWSDVDAKWIPARVPWVEPIVAPLPPSTNIFTNITKVPGPYGTMQQQSVLPSATNRAFVVKATGNWFTKDFVTFTQPWVSNGGNVTDTCTTAIYINGMYILYNNDMYSNNTAPYFISDDGLNWFQQSVTGITGTFSYAYLRAFGNDVWGGKYGGNFYWTADGVTWNKTASYVGSTESYNLWFYPTFLTESNTYAIGKSFDAVLDIFDTTVYPPAHVRAVNVSNLSNCGAIGENFYYAQSIGSTSDIYKSTDFGVTWTKIGSAARGNANKASVINNRLYFYGNGNGVIVVDGNTDSVNLYHSANFIEFVGANSNGKLVLNEAITNTDGSYWDLATADIYGEITYKEFIIDDLVNVNTSNKEDGEVLTWNTATQKWINSSIPEQIIIDTVVHEQTTAGAVTFQAGVLPAGVLIPTGAITSLDWIGVTGATSTSIRTVLTTIIKQNATAYLPTSYKINGTAVTVKWAGGVAPTAGTANGINVITLDVIRVGSAYTVMGQMVSFA